MPHWFGRLMVALRHLEFGFHLTSANLNLEPPYLNRDPMSLTGALLVSHVSFIPMALPFPCLSYSHVSLIPVSHPFLCLPILISLPFPYLSHSHVSLILIPVSLPYPCLSHSRVSLIPMSLSVSCLSHSYFSPIPKTLSFSCLSHSHVSPVPISRSFSYLSCSQDSSFLSLTLLSVYFCFVCLFNNSNYRLRHSYNPISLLLFP